MKKSVFLAIAIVVGLTGCDDKVKYVDINGECKYIEINGELMMCSEMKEPSQFEKIYVHPCMKVINKNGEKPNTDRCKF